MTDGTEERRSDQDVFYDNPASRAVHYSGIRDSSESIADGSGLIAPGDRASLHAAAVELYADAGIPPTEAAMVHEIVARFHGTPASADERTGWERETTAQLHERYGEEAPAKLAAVKAFIAARPKVAEMLNRTGVGSHPRLVLALVENADRLRVAPRGGVGK